MGKSGEKHSSASVARLLDKPIPNMVARVIVVLVGMALVAFGIALSRQTLLGSSPISAIPTVLSFAFPFTVGTFTFGISLIFLALQVILLRRDFSPVQLLQLPFLFLFSATIDMFVVVVSGWPFDAYALRVAWILVSCVAVGLGVYLQTQVRLIMLPGDAVVVAIANVSGWQFSKCKLGFDITQMVLAVAISLACSGALVGVREGTLIAALIVGPIIQLISRAVGDFHRFVPVDGHPTFLPDAGASKSDSDVEPEPVFNGAIDI